MKEAGNDLGITPDSIRYWTRKSMSILMGFTFIFLDTFDGDEAAYLKQTIEYQNKYFVPRKPGRRSRIICLDANVEFRSATAAANWIHTDADSIIWAVDEQRCCKGHVFVRESEFHYSDIRRYIDYCYTRSRDYKHLASKPVHSLDD